MTIDCASCNRSGDPSTTLSSICTRCWLRLPQVTRQLYAHGGIDKPRVIAAARERSTSAKVLGGGRR